MNKKERIDVLAAVGLKLKGEGIPEEIVTKTYATNPWFTKDSIQKAVAAIAHSYLDKEKLNTWLASYDESKSIKKVGLVLAGNIPLVGIHDIISVFAANHHAMIKMSEKDSILTKYFIELLCKVDNRADNYFKEVDRLSGHDAVIATGSDSAGSYFEKYFSSVPHIIRRNRNGVAIVYRDTTEQNMHQLGHDMLAYFGLGCRNVSKLYLEKGIELKKVYEPVEEMRDIIHHNKYKNNYDYSYALYLLNKEEFFTNDFLIMRENSSLNSRIACMHYEYFDDTEVLSAELTQIKNKIQCFISDRPLPGHDIVPFGSGQDPALNDYADGVDTMAFLTQL